MNTDTFYKLFIVVFFLLYLLLAFAWPTVRAYKMTGINPVTFGNSDSAHDFVGRWFKILIGFTLLSVTGYCFPDDVYPYMAPLDYLHLPALQGIGTILAIGSLIWISVAQFQMGASWRIGLDHKNKTPLIRHGLFSVSRNPVFLGMLVSLLGFFLLLPNALTFLVLITGYLLIQIQIRLEEEFLLTQHGKAYKMYSQKVRRLI